MRLLFVNAYVDKFAHTIICAMNKNTKIILSQNLSPVEAHPIRNFRSNQSTPGRFGNIDCAAVVYQIDGGSGLRLNDGLTISFISGLGPDAMSWAWPVVVLTND